MMSTYHCFLETLHRDEGAVERNGGRGREQEGPSCFKGSMARCCDAEARATTSLYQS